jgi:cytochrome b6
MKESKAPTTQADFALRRAATALSIAILTLTITGMTTGVLLSFYYEPIAGGAHDSLQTISTTVSYGWLFRKMHSLAGYGVIGIALIQIVVMFLGRQFTSSWLFAWFSGILFTLSAIGLAWTSMILGWDQDGFWRFNLELGTIQSIPLIGPQLREILTGGGAISTLTIEHLYTIHSYVVSTGAVILAVLHLSGLVWQEKEMSETQSPAEVTQSIAE